MSVQKTGIERTVREVNNDIAYCLVKRIMDILCSSVALIVLSPILLTLVVAILVEDGGPVFYTQERVGQGKKTFRIYKLRSMSKNAEKIHEQMRAEYGNEEVSFKLKDDPRVTKVGKIIRKFNLDELPQLINILKGDMSIVGPRPLPTYEFEEEQKRYGNTYEKRYQVPGGLTCYWQISDRAKTEFGERMQMDVDYAETCGLSVDMVCIFKTLIYTITGKAAY